MIGMKVGLFGLLILIADVWAIVNVFQSPAITGSKVFCIVLILILPVAGLIVWFFAGQAGKMREILELLNLRSSVLSNY
jgi:hypothetical protein